MDWSLYKPNAESQVSLNDTDACVSYATIHSIESQIKKLTGRTVDLSERWLAKMSGTTLAGNYVTRVFETIQKYGLVFDKDWNEPFSFDWQTYYADIPEDIQIKGQEFLQEWDIEVFYNIEEADVETALTHAPLVTIITHDTPIHCVERLNAKEYFDSYPPFTKELTTVHSNHQIIIRPKGHTMLIYKFDDNATEYILTDDATLIGIADANALAKTIKARPIKTILLPASQRDNFTIADSAIN